MSVAVDGTDLEVLRERARRESYAARIVGAGRRPHAPADLDVEVLSAVCGLLKSERSPRVAHGAWQARGMGTTRRQFATPGLRAW